MPYRTPTGNRIISGIQLLIVVAALVYAYISVPASTTDTWVILLTVLLALLGVASAFYLVTGRSEGNTAVKGFPRPRATRTLGFAAAAMFAVLFIITAVSGSTDQLDRFTVLLNGLWGYLFLYLLASATIAQAQIMRERQSTADPNDATPSD